MSDLSRVPAPDASTTTRAGAVDDVPVAAVGLRWSREEVSALLLNNRKAGEIERAVTSSTEQEPSRWGLRTLGAGRLQLRDPLRRTHPIP